MSTFAAPSQGEILKPNDIVGHTLILRPLRHNPNGPTVNGQVKDAIHTDVAVLTLADPATGQAKVYKDISWINTKLIGGLKGRIGELVLARMHIGQAKPGQNPPFELLDVTGEAEMVAAAEAFVAAHPEWLAPVPAQPAAVAAPAPMAPAPIQPVTPAPAPALVQPATVTQTPAAMTHPVTPVAAPVVPAPTLPAVPAPAPTAAPQVIPQAVWGQLSPDQQAQMTAAGYTVV